MKTALHRKLMGMCRISSREPRHWMMERGRSVRVESLDRVVSIKRVMYAAFRGPIQENMDVYQECGLKWCASPYHMSLRPARTRSLPVALPDEIASLSKPDTYFKPGVTKILPSGVTLKLIRLVKKMCSDGSSLRSISDTVGLPIVDVVKIRNGKFDTASKLKSTRELRLYAGVAIDDGLNARLAEIESSTKVVVSAAPRVVAPSRSAFDSVPAPAGDSGLPPGVKLASPETLAKSFRPWRGDDPPVRADVVVERIQTPVEIPQRRQEVQRVTPEGVSNAETHIRAAHAEHVGADIDESVPTYVPVRTREELDMTEDERAWLQNMMVAAR